MSKTAIVSLLLFLQACFSLNEEIKPEYQDYQLSNVPYKLYSPYAEYKLHWDLEEISGLSYYKNNQLLAIEDETGNVYIIDGDSGEKTRKIKCHF